MNSNTNSNSVKTFISTNRDLRVPNPTRGHAEPLRRSGKLETYCDDTGGEVSDKIVFKISCPQQNLLCLFIECNLERQKMVNNYCHAAHNLSLCLT